MMMQTCKMLSFLWDLWVKKRDPGSQDPGFLHVFDDDDGDVDDDNDDDDVKADDDNDDEDDNDNNGKDDHNKYNKNNYKNN